MVKKEEKKSELESLSGLGPATLEKLESAGITTLMALAVTSPVEVSTVAGISEAVGRKLIQQARENLQLGFEKAKEYSKRRDKIKKIGTGCSNFDTMLDGGFESGAITEVFGQFGSGKTQLGHLLVVRALIEDKKNKAIFLDTENTFRPDRITDFANANGLDPEEAMDRIYVSRAYNCDHQMLLVDEIEKMLQADQSYRVIVVDSLTSHFRAEFIGRGMLADRQQKLNKHMHQLLKLADLYNMVVLVTNQVQSNPGTFYGDPTQPIGGHIVGHNSTFRIYLRPGKEASIHARLMDSPNLPNNDCNFWITKEGFVDEKPKE
jgi:DNA repair protein RadA